MSNARKLQGKISVEYVYLEDKAWRDETILVVESKHPTDSVSVILLTIAVYLTNNLIGFTVFYS